QPLAGAITITSIGRVGLLSVSGVEARLAGADGRPLLVVSGLEASLDALRLARSALGSGPVELGRVRITAAELSVGLYAGASVELGSLEALAPRAPAEAAGAGRPLEVEVEALSVGELRVRGVAGLITGDLFTGDLVTGNLA